MSYRVTSNYGWRKHPITGNKKFHSGIDLVKYHKAGIASFTNGIVLYAGKGQKGTGLGGYGNVVFIKDHEGHGHLYAHLDSVKVKKGNQIVKGKIIGTQGATGNVTGSHLHYEVRKKTSPSYGWTNKPEKNTLNPKLFMNTKGVKRKVMKIKVDAMLGKNTIKRSQQFFGTPMDGKISPVSIMIKNLQKFLNQLLNSKLTVDGRLGKKTISHWQKLMKTPVDGKISKKSNLIEAWQTFLNRYGQ